MSSKKLNKKVNHNLFVDDEDEKPTFTFPPIIDNKKINTLKDDDEDEDQSSSSDEEDIKFTKKSLVGGVADEEEDEAEVEESDTEVDDEDDDDKEEDEDGEEVEAEGDVDDEGVKSKSKKSLASVKVKSKKSKPVAEIPTFLDEDLNEDEDDDDDDYEEDDYLQKFERDTNDEYLIKFHPESKINNYDEVQTLATVVRDETGKIIDPLHKTIPIMTKYEKARILGIRAKQINNGSKIFLSNVPNTIIDGYVLANMELEQKLIPFIIRRPLPNGLSEYWRLSDLQLIV